MESRREQNRPLLFVDMNEIYFSLDVSSMDVPGSKRGKAKPGGRVNSGELFDLT